VLTGALGTRLAPASPPLPSAALLAQNEPAAPPTEPQPDDKPAAAPAETATPAASEAAATRASAREKLLGYRSVRAKVQERVDIAGREFKATGSYIQGADLKLRLEYDVKLGSGEGAFEGSLLQVCDGQVLWTRYLLDEGVDGKEEPKPRITRRDVQLILDTVAKGGKIPQNLLVTELGLGGLPSLMAAIEMSMTFDSQESTDDGKMLMISGKWKDELLKNLPRAQEYPDALADYVPDAIRVYFDQENLFPRRILYLKKHPKRGYLRPMVSVDFVEVTLNGPVNEEDFQYIPPDGVFPVNITNEYLRRLVSAQPPAAPGAQGQPQPAASATPAQTQPGTAPSQGQPSPERPSNLGSSISPAGAAPAGAGAM
jgi:hypothetical protein